MLHARKATQAESWQREIHKRLGVDASPGGVRKPLVQPRRRREHARNAVPHAGFRGRNVLIANDL